MKIGKIKFDEGVPYDNIKQCCDSLVDNGFELTNRGYSEFDINDPDLKKDNEVQSEDK